MLHETTLFICMTVAATLAIHPTEPPDTHAPAKLAPCPAPICVGVVCLTQPCVEPEEPDRRRLNGDIEPAESGDPRGPRPGR